MEWGLDFDERANRWYVSFCDCCTFRFIFRTFRFRSVARFVLRIILTHFPMHADYRLHNLRQSLKSYFVYMKIDLKKLSEMIFSEDS